VELFDLAVGRQLERQVICTGGTTLAWATAKASAWTGSVKAAGGRGRLEPPWTSVNTWVPSLSSWALVRRKWPAFQLSS
jgi:hypothetical protein